MVKRSDCSNRIAVTKQRSRCLGQDGSGRPRCELGLFAGPLNTWGCFTPMIRPKHGVDRAPFLLGRWVRVLPMLAGTAPSYSHFDCFVLELCLCPRFHHEFLTSVPLGVPKVLRSQISRPGAPGRGDVREHVTSFFWMRCGCVRVCQHGLPCVEMVMRFG
ncbi:unnamed protein product [Prunus brigantina]